MPVPRLSRSARVAAALVLLAIPGPSGASPLSWGLRAGMSTARLYGSYGEVVGDHYRDDITAGLYGALRLAGGWSFQPEVAVVSKGGRGDLRFGISSGGTTEVWDAHLEHHLGYLEFPLLLRYDMTTGGFVEPYLVAGPVPAWRIGKGRTEEKIEISSSPSARPARGAAQIFEGVGTFDPISETDSFDMGLVGGLGVMLGRGQLRLGLEGRYTRGVVDVSPLSIRNAAFAFTTVIEIR